MRLFLLLSVLLASSIPVQAQICTGDFRLKTQAEVNAFDCTEVTGNLVLGGFSIFFDPSDITDLSPLSMLTSVGGALRIENNDLLTSLAGLENLASASRLEVGPSNTALPDLTGLEGLTSLPSYLEVFFNPMLRSLSGLENLTSVGSLFIEENPMLESISALGNLTFIGDDSTIFSDRLIIDSNPVLVSISALENAIFHNLDYLEILDNPALESLNGLGGVTSVGFRLVVINNDALRNLSGLGNVTTVEGTVGISDNEALESLEGLESLETAHFLRILDNPALVSILAVRNVSFLGNTEPRQGFRRLGIRRNENLRRCSCGLARLISGTPPAFTGVDGSIAIEENDPRGACTSPGVVLAAPCNLPSSGSFSATATSSTTVPPGGAVSFEYAITNLASTPADGDLWFTAARGDTLLAAGVIQSRVLPVGQTVEIDFTQHVPGAAQAGVYDYVLHVGQYPDFIVASEAFEITVTGAPSTLGTPDVVGAWTVSDVMSSKAANEATTAPVLNNSSEAVDEMFGLDSMYPNPFAQSTALTYRLDAAAYVTVEVFDVRGRRVATLVNGEQSGGEHRVTWDGADTATGTYFVRLSADGQQQTRSVTLTR